MLLARLAWSQFAASWTIRPIVLSISQEQRQQCLLCASCTQPRSLDPATSRARGLEFSTPESVSFNLGTGYKPTTSQNLSARVAACLNQERDKTAKVLRT